MSRIAVFITYVGVIFAIFSVGVTIIYLVSEPDTKDSEYVPIEDHTLIFHAREAVKKELANEAIKYEFLNDYVLDRNQFQLEYYDFLHNETNYVVFGTIQKNVLVGSRLTDYEVELDVDGEVLSVTFQAN